jgi:hypothetical protein
VTLTLRTPSRPHLARLLALTQEAQRRNLDLEPIKRQAQARAAELARCHQSPEHFIDRYVQIEAVDERGEGAWAPFHLWPAQRATLAELHRARLVVILKARQLGLSWLVLAYILWQLTQRPIANALIFSRRDTEAIHLLNMRLAGMARRLPPELNGGGITTDATHALRLANGSTALAFPTTGGRSYTASIALVDEADYVDDLDGLLNAVKPTVEAGGKLILISTTDKSKPESAFKRVYNAAAAGQSDWRAVFLPWSARPGRTPEWYAAQHRDVLARTGWLDDLYQEYPATALEALAGKSADKRFPPAWLAQCDGTADAALGQPGEIGPALPSLTVYVAPEPGKIYVIGADPAEGNPQSDESAATVLEAESQTQVAVLAGRLDPAVFGAQLGLVSEYYNHADVLVERNNHGHAVILYLVAFTGARVLFGRDGRHGWNETPVSKSVAFDHAADTFRGGNARIADQVTMQQLAAVTGATLAAPVGQHDDRAIAFALALAALAFCQAGAGGTTANIAPVDIIALADARGFKAEADW